jgi:NADP-dependent 3-hydroxy acid dehydrogenase YdfG
LVTGASSGIGAATARQLAAAGYPVLAVARRSDRLESVVDQIRQAGGVAHLIEADITDQVAVDRIADRATELGQQLGRPLEVLVNNAGGAVGLEPVAEADLDAWRQMYEVNVLGTARVTRALLPQLRAGGAATVVIIGSTAGLAVYEGGAGYTGAKHAERAVAQTLRLELCGQPIRVVEIDPGMVRTEEFSLNRFAGDAARAAAVYDNVPDPLVAQDIAEAVQWCVTRPHHVNIDQLVIRPLAQAANHKVHRGPLR